MKTITFNSKISLMRHFALALAVSSCLIAGCSLAPIYERPPAPIPAHWQAEVLNQGKETAPLSDAPLDWRSFVINERLRNLVAIALENNRDLRQTILNIEAARAQFRVQRADRLPSISLNGTGSRQRVPGDLNVSGESGVVTSYQAGIALTAFEVDLFGRVKSLSDAALQEYFAIEANANAARLGLVAEVIQAYLARDSAYRRLALTRQTLDSRNKSLELVSKRREAGTTTVLDYQEAFGLREQAKADFERIDRELRQAVNALQLLVGVSDLDKFLPQEPIDMPFVRQIVPGAPSDLLTNRPDILAAEYRLRSKNASIGAARAAFFPRITLTTALGSSSAALSALFESGQNSWSFLPQLSLPIFQGGQNVANLDLATVRKDMAIAEYEKTIQVAFREVSDALDASATLKREEESRRSLRDASSETLRLSEARYKAGVDNHLRYLDAQRSHYANEIGLIESRTSRQIALTSLFKSLGGGWKLEPEER